MLGPTSFLLGDSMTFQPIRQSSLLRSLPTR